METRCEVCGRVIHGSAREVVIEGAVMRVCSHCARLGSQQTRGVPKAMGGGLRKPRSLEPMHARHKQFTPGAGGEEELTLVPDYSVVVKRARERVGWTQEELGRRVGEKASVISKIETGRLRPSIALAKKLEHVLKVRLITSIEEIEDSL